MTDVTELPVYEQAAGEAEIIAYLEEALKLAREKRIHQLVIAYDTDVETRPKFHLKTMLCHNARHHGALIAEIRKELATVKSPEPRQLNG